MSPGPSRRIDRRFRPQASLRYRMCENLPSFLTRRAEAVGHPHSYSIQCIDMRWHPPMAHPSLSITRCILRDMRFRPVSTRPSPSQKLKEQPNRLFLPREMMLPPLAFCADTTPSTDETGLPEQVGLDRHGIKAGHVFLGVNAFDVELVALGNHETKNRARRNRRPTTYLNRSVSTDSC
ncbi:hypothetical protein J2S28_005776 [Rhizobium sp. SLBN-94]|nr:hypothetical protein [Rhizobium sp. SLBN-94]